MICFTVKCERQMQTIYTEANNLPDELRESGHCLDLQGLPLLQVPKDMGGGRCKQGSPHWIDSQRQQSPLQQTLLSRNLPMTEQPEDPRLRVLTPCRTWEWELPVPPSLVPAFAPPKH